MRLIVSGMNRLLRLHLRTRTLLGALFVLAFAANTYEALLPDVHDGDATTVAVQHSAALADAGHATSDQDRPAHPPAPDLPHHAQHADHCSHSHVASLACAVALSETPLVVRAVPLGADDRLRGIAHAPGLRPPIV